MKRKGLTIIEKIFTRASGKKVKPDDYVWANIDLVAMRDFGGPNFVQEYRENFQNASVFDNNRVAITFDLHIPPRNEKVARNQQILREFAEKQRCYLVHSQEFNHKRRIEQDDRIFRRNNPDDGHK